MFTIRHCLTFAVLLPAAVPAAPAQASKDATKTPIARMVHYTGQVQGVGFRDTAVGIARKYTVTGWVKNLADGRVQLLVEGPETEVRAFLEAVRTHWRKNIDKEQVSERPVEGKYKTFEVVR